MLLLSVGPVIAAGVGGATWSPSYFVDSKGLSNFRTLDSAYYVYTTISWNTTQRSGLHNYFADHPAWRYTQDVRDQNSHMNATGNWTSNFPNPVFDRDDDDGDEQWEEGEATSNNNTTFPAASTDYRANIQFSRWFQACSLAGCVWIWDGLPGSWGHSSQLSAYQLGEWNTQQYTAAYETTPYPQRDTPTTAVAAPPSYPSSGQTASYRSQRKDIRVPDAISVASRRALNTRYATQADWADGAAVVVTFDRPVTWNHFMSLASDGVRWRTFEGVGGNGDDLVWSCGGLVGSGRDAVCQDGLVRYDGIVSAEGYVESIASFRSLDHHRIVVLVDLSKEIRMERSAARGRPVGVEDVVANDVYWIYASLQ